MTDLQELFKTVDQLTAHELKQLYQYILENRIQFAEHKPARPSQHIIEIA